MHNILKLQSFMKYFNEYIEKHQIDFVDKKSQRKRLNILVPLLKSFGWRFLAANLCAFIGFAWQFSNPMVSLVSSHIYLVASIFYGKHNIAVFIYWKKIRDLYELPSQSGQPI